MPQACPTLPQLYLWKIATRNPRSLSRFTSRWLLPPSFSLEFVEGILAPSPYPPLSLPQDLQSRSILLRVCLKTPSSLPWDDRSLNPSPILNLPRGNLHPYLVPPQVCLGTTFELTRSSIKSLLRKITASTTLVPLSCLSRYNNPRPLWSLP